MDTLPEAPSSFNNLIVFGVIVLILLILAIIYYTKFYKNKKVTFKNTEPEVIAEVSETSKEA
jgi:hypothetical protein